MVASHLVLTDSIEVVKTALSSGRPVVALAYKKCSRQKLDHREYANWRLAIDLCAACGFKWDVTPQVQANPLFALDAG